MEIRLLRYFIALANSQTISEAAKNLHISQPTLSRQLSELEEELGTQLFIRGHRQVTLTSDGFFFLAKAKEIVQLTDKTVANFQHSEEVLGDIHIGGGESDAMKIIAHSVKQLADKHPQIQFHLFSGNSEAIFEKLDDGVLDFGIVVDPVDKKNYDYIQLPIQDTWGVLMPTDSPLASKKKIQANDLREVPLIMSQQAIRYGEFSAWFEQDINELNIRCTYNLLYNAAKMVEAHVGYAICLDKLIDTYHSHSLCFRPLSPQLTANLYLIWKKQQVFPKAATLFLRQLKTDIAKDN